MNKKSSFTWVFPILIILIFPFNTVNCQNTQNVQGNWTGSISFHEKANTITGWSVKTINVSIRDNKGTGTIKYEDETIIEGKSYGKSDCQGSGDVDLVTVLLNPYDSIYEISTIGPTCSSGSNPWDPYHGNGIGILDHKFTNSNVLAGSESKTIEIEGNLGTVTTTITWNLTRTPENDVELIVIPENYDTWLPEPGRTERTAGSIMKVSLKLRGRNGTTTNKKAKSFELKLINTSSEPGTTINYPVNSTNTSFDLKFMPQNDGVPGDTAFQNFIIPCFPSRQTADFKIGSYDGGGWTVLNAEAVLDDQMETRVQGRLLASDGEIDIRIPKREPNSKIAEAWLKQYENPGEMDDKETSKGNNNNGDGFTAYEEYRGVIAESKFQRLNPGKKELGILATKRDYTLFNEGIGWFKTSSDLELVRFDFDKEEIAPDGKLNMNKKTAHDYDQYALYLLNGGLEEGTLGIVYSKTNKPDLPAQIISVVADWSQVQGAYQERVTGTRPDVLKFSLKEYLAQTVAHELGHAVNIWHHGRDLRLDNYIAATKKYAPFTVNEVSDKIRIFDRHGNLITTRPYTLFNIGSVAGTVESGDLSCMLNYYPYYRWGYALGADGAHIYNQEPLIPLGKAFCKSGIATDFNTTQLYFGNAARGNCLSQIKLRN